MQRINKMGGVSMLSNTTASSAFTAPTLVTSLSDDDSINNETISQVIPSRLVTEQPSSFRLIFRTSSTPCRFPHRQQHFHHPSSSLRQPITIHIHRYRSRQSIRRTNSNLCTIITVDQVFTSGSSDVLNLFSRMSKGSSMGGMGYSQMPIWSPGPYPQPSPNGKAISCRAQKSHLLV